VRVDRDFLAVGAASVLASVTGGFAVNASPTRTGVVAASNGRSQAVNLTAGVLVAAVLLVATGLIARLPEATLGGILVAVGVKLVKWRDLAAVACYSRPEWAIVLATLLVVAVVGIQEGIYLAIALALLRRTYLSARRRVGLPPPPAGRGGAAGRRGLPLRRAALLRQRSALCRAHPSRD
jgi:SulP family sulfate permease